MKPRPAKDGGHQPEASLAWVLARALAKRRQRVCGPRNGIPKGSLFLEADTFLEVEGNTDVRRHRAKPGT